MKCWVVLSSLSCHVCLSFVVFDLCLSLMLCCCSSRCLCLCLCLCLASNRPNYTMAPKDPHTIVLFDVDGTLTAARETVTDEMKARIAALRKEVVVGVVGGSDFEKQKEQLGDDVLECFDFSFSENGLMAYRDGKELAVASLKKHLGEDNIKRLVNFILRYLSELDIPVKRGTFIEFRNGMLNVSPIGRNCSKGERNDYEKFDLEHGIRKNMVAVLQKEFADLDLVYSIGGQISFDVFPRGWDKTYCLQFLDEKQFTSVHFFGDKTFEGGNDYEIFTHPRTIGHTVTKFEDTIRILDELFPASIF
jgi:phosphomannomutase